MALELSPQDPTKAAGAGVPPQKQAIGGKVGSTGFSLEPATSADTTKLSPMAAAPGSMASSEASSVGDAGSVDNAPAPSNQQKIVDQATKDLSDRLKTDQKEIKNDPEREDYAHKQHYIWAYAQLENALNLPANTPLPPVFVDQLNKTYKGTISEFNKTLPQDQQMSVDPPPIDFSEIEDIRKSYPRG